MKTLFLLTAILITYSVTAQQTQVINYGYNARGELISIVQDGDSLTYIYDDAGNRITSTLNTVAIKENKDLTDKYELKCYPNPATDGVMLVFNLNETTSYSVDLFHQNGSFIKNVVAEKNTIGVKTLNISLSDLSPGAFFIVFRTDKKSVVKKVIKL